MQWLNYKTLQVKVIVLLATCIGSCLHVRAQCGANSGAVVFSGGAPFSIASGDLNMDGHTDLVAANVSNNTVSILLGNGTGGFTAATAPGVGNQPRSVWLADLNGDGKLDLITANFNSNTVSILLGNGSGGFAAATNLSVPGFGADYALTGDFNNDGKPDLLVAYLNSNFLSVLPGNGLGGFGAPINSPVPNGPQQVAIGDFNGDGKADIAVPVISGLSILLGKGDGGFSSATTLPTSSTTNSVAVADFNGDGKADLASIVDNANQLRVYSGDGQGNFLLSASYAPIGGGPDWIVADDYNADGNVDVAIANLDGTASIMLGDGLGGFNSPLVYMNGGAVSRSLTSADFNSDGRPDLAFANQGSSSVSVILNSCSSPPPVLAALSVDDVSVTEGDSGTVNATFTVSLSNSTNKTVSVSFYAADINAVKGVDYQNTLGRLTFAPGVTSQTIAVPVLGDAVDEFDEQFNVILAYPLNAKLSKEKGVGTILDNDPPPTVSLSDASIREGNAGLTSVSVPVTLSSASGKPITVDYSTADGTAQAGNDYLAKSGSISFAPGEIQKNIQLQIVGDTNVEPDEYFFVNLSNPSNVMLVGSQSKVTVVNDDVAVQFDNSNYSVNEGDGHVTITVTRTGDTSNASTVDYHSTDTDTFTVNCGAKQGQAFGRCDFATVVGTASFAAGETSKTFTVPIINDGWGEGDETFGVALSNAIGATLGAQSTATITIHDNETVDQPNPILQTDPVNVDFFVRQHYLDFLGREPEQGQPWSGLLNGCADQFNVDPNSSAAGCDRITVSGAFFGSPEFKTKGFYVIDMYRVAFGRLPSYTEFSIDLASISGATAAEVFAKRAAYATNFIQRGEFQGFYPNSISNSAFVNALMSGDVNQGGRGQNYNLTTIHTTDPANPDTGNQVALTTTDLINRLNNSTLTRAQVLRAIAQSDEISLQLEALNAFVASQYYGYLRRTPDTGGFNNWVNYLKANPNDFRTMVNGFMNSNEYRLRFGPVQ